MEAVTRQVDYTEAETPLMLTPDNIAQMLRARDEHQVTKFRTTCSDCVPNL